MSDWVEIVAIANKFFEALDELDLYLETHPHITEHEMYERERLLLESLEDYPRVIGKRIRQWKHPKKK
jgi:hypothetical protein